MQALISDIHANIEALDAVLRDIESRGVEEILCLGDSVGYGPDPEACLDVIMARARVTLLGNHDHALVCGGESEFTSVAAEMISRTRETMLGHITGGHACPADSQDMPCLRDGRCPSCLTLRHEPTARWRFVADLPECHTEGDVLYVHASPLDPIFEYVFPDHFGRAWRPARVAQIMEAVPWVAFGGHTHVPCAITAQLACIYPQPDAPAIRLARDTKYLVNLGSVGQPRDGDPRACYVLFDAREGSIEWRRVPYDIGVTSRRIEAMCGRGNWCARRLWLGH